MSPVLDTLEEMGIKIGGYDESDESGYCVEEGRDETKNRQGNEIKEGGG
jgi:hypothetical protein